MRNLINVMTNRVKYTQEIQFIWDDKTQELVKLNGEDRLEKVQNNGAEQVFKFNLTLSINSRKDKDSLSDSVTVTANSEREAADIAANYFLATYVHRITLAQMSNDSKITLTLDRLYSKEEAEQYDKEMQEFDEYLDSVYDYQESCLVN